MLIEVEMVWGIGYCKTLFTTVALPKAQCRKKTAPIVVYALGSGTCDEGLFVTQLFLLTGTIALHRSKASALLYTWLGLFVVWLVVTLTKHASGV